MYAYSLFVTHTDIIFSPLPSGNQGHGWAPSYEEDVVANIIMRRVPGSYSCPGLHGVGIFFKSYGELARQGPEVMLTNVLNLKSTIPTKFGNQTRIIWSLKIGSYS